MKPTVLNTPRFVAVAILMCISIAGFTQAPDTLNHNNKKNNNIFGKAIDVFRRSPDTVQNQQGINTKSETQYMPYRGKFIRHIKIIKYGFEISFSDTTKRIAYFGTRVLNSLHRDTREWVIRDNLFIKEKTELNPYVVADNERYLRSLEFIQDARIQVNYIPDEPDSVDLIVITKDLFSISGDLSNLSTGKFRGSVSEANLLGTAQKIKFTPLIESSRSPGFGYEFLYSKNNIANSFVNATVVYSQIRPSINDGFPDEHTYLFMLERPLFSQYSHFAGAVSYSRTKSVNYYTKPDSLFYKYRYINYDAWLGYNINVKKFINNTDYKARKFISFRYFNNHFTEDPFQVDSQLNYRYNNREALLGRFTFFSQRFYKTNYLFGFGTTEDVPYGYNISVTSGYYRQAYLKRLYLGLDANRYAITGAGNVIQYFLRTETFFRNKKSEDASLLAGISIFSRLVQYENVKLRQYMRFSFARQFNRVGLDALYINNTFGIPSFRSDSARGQQRISLHSETYLFLKYKLFGFKFAPFAFGDASLLTPENKGFSKSGMYYGLGGGVRTRNENLIFNTIELRFVYFPRKEEISTSFKVTLEANIRFRYNSNYVKAPDLIQLNNDPDNNVF